MRTDPVTALFEEFCGRFELGEQPDVADYLERAGARAGELAELVNGYLLSAPLPEPSAAAVEQMQAWLDGNAPLVELRVARGLGRDQLAAALVGELGLRDESTPRLAERLHELEGGLLDIRRVSRRVLAALGRALDVRPEDLLAWPQPGLAGGAFARIAEEELPTDLAARLPSMAAPAWVEDRSVEWDEVDRLFLGGPDA